MKPERGSEKDEALNGLLGQWTVDAPLPPGFQDQVWHRIARAESQLQPGFWGGLRRWLEREGRRAQVAYSYVAILLLLGLLAGSWAAQTKSRELNAALGARYVQSIDPYRN